MTDKEFKRLSRSQLIEVIYQLQLQIENLTKQNQQLKNALDDKHLRISNTGNLAEAALEINNCFKSAQDAANQYLSEIEEMKAETEKEQQKILADAKLKAAAIILSAKNAQGNYDHIIEAILKKYRQSLSDKG